MHFEDHETFIECTYLDVSMKIYYDDKAIVSVDIDEQCKKKIKLMHSDELE